MSPREGKGKDESLVDSFLDEFERKLANQYPHFRRQHLAEVTAQAARGMYLDHFAWIDRELGSVITQYFEVSQDRSGFARHVLVPLPFLTKVDVLDHVIKERQLSGFGNLPGDLRKAAVVRNRYAHGSLFSPHHHDLDPAKKQNLIVCEHPPVLRTPALRWYSTLERSLDAGTTSA